MATRATQETIVERVSIGNLFLPVPDTDFRDFLEEVEELARFAPEIIDAIEADLDIHAKEKKKLRLADKEFFASQTCDLIGIDIEGQEILSNELKLFYGRPRMPADLVYLFVMIRGFLGGKLASKQARRFLYESMNLYSFFQSRGRKMPGITTILENVNVVSDATRDLILRKQIELILKENLDDFRKLTIDSTAVKANSCWPTDARIITGLLTRADRLGQKLYGFRLKKFQQGWVPRWLKEMDKLEFQICMVAGKPKSKGKLKKHYRRLLKRGRKATDYLAKELKQFEQSVSMEALAPSRRALLQRIIQQIKTDVSDSSKVIKYADDWIFRGKSLPSTEKVLSLSDGSAAYIKKGSRNPVIGYKPQLIRSENGFVASLIVPQGNAADSVELAPAISNSMKRTGIIADLVSTDDGYASTNGRKEVLAMGVKDVSISGAKGKKLTNELDWESDVYRDARRNRSAVESLMFTIKDGFEFGELGRRGLEPVRAELMEKVLAYNCCRIILMKKRRRKELEKAA